ncbi:PREDICTED: uncharacterized protein LOC104761044 isoform X1 [Camelina sativa]|uniref:Uncharacterized protein LOC104761044 isoform X1 n=1 Tax=Camelina sativa TaxID=90675 RepID=A0ABM0X8Q7_CAMSA|nr:PREDICTED: uncharacterized protein LOC104761044 isoform X1 [Camelina sativa]
MREDGERVFRVFRWVIGLGDGPEVHLQGDAILFLQGEIGQYRVLSSGFDLIRWETIWGLGESDLQSWSYLLDSTLCIGIFLVYDFHSSRRISSSFLLFRLLCSLCTMAQLALNKGKASLLRTETVNVSNTVLAQRIQQFSRTLIGRLMNPSIQRMESLVANLPKIWKLEDRVVGPNLGQGIFQFNFEDEADLQAVLQNGPYHFDGWMISLVKWEPIISSTYPSAINFWVKVGGIPLHLWETATLQAIGKKIGTLREIDGSICVTVNGFNPLLFQLVVPFDTGDEVVVSLDYEKLTGFCDHCSRLTHEVRVCPELHKVMGAHGGEIVTDKRGGQRHQSVAKQWSAHSDGGWEKPRKFAM